MDRFLRQHTVTALAHLHRAKGDLLYYGVCSDLLRVSELTKGSSKPVSVSPVEPSDLTLLDLRACAFRYLGIVSYCTKLSNSSNLTCASLAPSSKGYVFRIVKSQPP